MHLYLVIVDWFFSRSHCVLTAWPGTKTAECCIHRPCSINIQVKKKVINPPHHPDRQDADATESSGRSFDPLRPPSVFLSCSAVSLQVLSQLKRGKKKIESGRRRRSHQTVVGRVGAGWKEQGRAVGGSPGRWVGSVVFISF